MNLFCPIYTTTSDKMEYMNSSNYSLNYQKGKQLSSVDVECQCSLVSHDDTTIIVMISECSVTFNLSRRTNVGYFQRT